MSLLNRIKSFLPMPPVSCPKCGHFGCPLSMKCEKCGASLMDLYR